MQRLESYKVRRMLFHKIRS